MPLGFGSPVFTSSAGGDIGGGRYYTRLRGPIYTGQPVSADAPGGSRVPFPPYIINVSTMLADVCNVPTTFMSTGGAFASTSAPTGLVWISITTGNLIAAGSTTNAPSPLIGGANAAAMCWDASKLTLAVYDPVSSAWLWPHSASSGAGGVIVWSASSS